mmetsp:Transcript_5985/g.19798  ORF Transcript_5985/g.19798 Transcript_5985/m.19798 type:complete len:102 (-) Transcript_5985:336-641(-)
MGLDHISLSACVLCRGSHSAPSDLTLHLLQACGANLIRSKQIMLATLFLQVDLHARVFRAGQRNVLCRSLYRLSFSAPYPHMQAPCHVLWTGGDEFSISYC